MKLTHKCPTCGVAVKTIQAEIPLGNLMNYVYQCGHIEIREAFKLTNEVNEIKDTVRPINELPSSIPHWAWALRECPEYFCDECKSIHNIKHAYKFQRDGVAFLESANCNGMIADEMGLGKTIQGILTLRKHPELLPCLAIVKGATILQWTNEINEWGFNGPVDTMPIIGRENIFPGLKVYVISMDMLSRKGVLEKLAALGLKSIILDECQSFKDASSKRTIALIRLLQENKIEHVIPLSGTPIKNRADEYFTILNLLAPSHFSSKSYFQRQFLLQDDKGNFTKINPYQEEYFKLVTSKFIIRREVKDVMKDLPPLRINFQLCEISDPALRGSYNYTLDLFKNYCQNKAQVTAAGMLGWLAKLRSITGQAKCKMAVDYVTDFIESVEDQKIAVGIHHTSVRDTLKYVFEAKGMNPLTLSGLDDNFEKGRIAAQFNTGPERILIINSVAGGVGLNLQGCNNFVQLERMWNGADEDQFVKRFHRNGQTKPVNGTYFIAAGTVDEFFHEMVWKKRNNLASAGIGESVDEMQSVEFLREFSEYIVDHKLN